MPRRTRTRRNTQAPRATDFDLRRTRRRLLTASSNSPQRHLSGGAPRDSSTNYPTLNKGVVQESALARTLDRWQQVGRVAIKERCDSSSKGSRMRFSYPANGMRQSPAVCDRFWACVGLDARTAGGARWYGRKGRPRPRRARAASSNALDSIPSQPSGGRASGAQFCDVVVVEVSRLRSIEVNAEVSEA